MSLCWWPGESVFAEKLCEKARVRGHESRNAKKDVARRVLVKFTLSTGVPLVSALV